MSNYRNICYAELMDIDWYNGWITILALKTDIGFIVTFLVVIVAGILLGMLLHQTFRAYKKSKQFPNSTLLPLMMIFTTYFLFIEAVQYYYLRPIAFYLLFLFLGAGLSSFVFVTRKNSKSYPRKKTLRK